MKRLFLPIIGCVLCLINSLPIKAMVARTLPSFSQSAARRIAAQKMQGMPRINSGAYSLAGQKRSLWTPESLKGLHNKLPEEVRAISPVHGVAKSASGVLPKMYAIESDSPAPAIKLVRELFHQHGQQFKPTAHITNAACALNPGILGLVLGALEKGKLQDAQARAYIMNEWRDEYAKIATDTKRSDGAVRSSKEVKKLLDKINDKIETLLTIVSDEYKQDKNSARSILLSFFAEKADLTSDHDMIDYLSGVNRFLSIFAQPQSQKSPTVLDKLQAFIQSMKNRIMGVPNENVYTPKNNVYTQKDYETFRTHAKTIGLNETMDFAQENFELALSSILNAKRNVSLYPPMVVRSTYGYQGQHPRANCVETAFQDLFNILLYNAQTQSFDLSFLPVGLQLSDVFKKFYEDHTGVNSINDGKTGQAFMNLVSNIDGAAYYQQKNYELDAKEGNFLIVTNYLLGTQAQDLTELGTLLSDQRRTVTFTLHTPEQDDVAKISMVIKDNNTHKELRADLGFRPGHGEISVTERKQRSDRSLLDPSYLSKNYNISQEAQALLSIQPDNVVSFLRINKNSAVPASAYYVLNTEGDWDKVETIQHILRQNANNEEALDYAIHLYKSLDMQSEINVFGEIMKTGIWHSHPKFKKLLVDLKDRVFNADDSSETNQYRVKIINSITKKDAELIDAEFIDYAFNLYQQLPVQDQKIVAENILASAIGSGAWISNDNLKNFVLSNLHNTIVAAVKMNVFDENMVSQLYERIADDVSKKRLLADVLTAFKNLPKSIRKEINFSMLPVASKLIQLGVDINAAAIETTGDTPLIAAAAIGDKGLVELLIQHGALVNEVVPVKHYDETDNITALYRAAGYGFSEIVDTLLKYGADPNLYSDVYHGLKSTPVGESVIHGDYDVTKLLLENGANPTLPVRRGISIFHWMMMQIAEVSKFVDLFIKHGVNVNLIVNDSTPLDCAYLRKLNYPSKDVDAMIEALKKAGAKTSAELRQQKESKNQLATE